MTVVAEPLTTALRIPVGGRIWLHADVCTPPSARGLVLFVHGGSRGHGPGNSYVAFALDAQRMATMVADLLTDDEERTDLRDPLRFDAGLFTHRLAQMIDWVHMDERLGTLPIGLFGAGPGAAAALDAAALRPDIVRAVVSRGGRPDLAVHLAAVKAPTLFLAGGNTTEVLDLNAMAARMMTCTRNIEVIPGASQLFDEPGTLEAVASSAGAWFRRYLPTVEHFN